MIYYHTPKQKKIKFKPGTKLNHNVYIFFRNPTTDFSLTSANKPQSYFCFITARLKSIVTVERAAQIAG